MKISPFKYTDYRKFLRDYFKESAATYLIVCKATGIKSPGHLSLILNGKVNISDLQADNFAGFCKLKKKETEFFRTMVLFNQEKKSDTKVGLFEKLSAFRNSSIYRVGPHLYKFYDKWYHSVVRALLEFVDIRDNAGDLGKMVAPSIKPEQAISSVRLLSELGLISADDRGFLRPTEKSIDTGSTAGSVMVNRFVLSMLDLAHEAMGRFPRNERIFSCVTLGINEKGYDELLAELRKFRRKVAKIAGKYPANRVVQLNFQLFPVSKGVGTGEGCDA
jgi:uncharacterized protein (TIGR02147 family)